MKRNKLEEAFKANFHSTSSLLNNKGNHIQEKLLIKEFNEVKELIDFYWIQKNKH